MKLVEMCNKQTSEVFEFKTGLSQRDTLSPVLFNSALEKVIRVIQEKGEMELIGSNLLLADVDVIVILGTSQKKIEEQV